ncbi:MAG: hypothetical protein ACXABF_17230 [Candidatus Thorarchaeota archaeon]|jgi:hypothetical protein
MSEYVELMTARELIDRLSNDESPFDNAIAMRDAFKGITNALLNGEATDIRIAAEGLARVVMLDRNRIRKLGHNAMLMWLAFTAMIEDMDKLSRELDERHDDGISNHSPTGKPDLSPS